MAVLKPDPGALASSSLVHLPPPPAWVQQSTLPPWSIDEIAGEIKRVTGRTPLISYTRSDFVRPDHRWLLDFEQWFRGLAKNLKIGYVDETWDCDNYARCFVAFADVAALKGGESRGSICVGWATVSNRRAFGGIPAGGAHAIVIVGTSAGLFAIEPQTGVMVPLTQYPNRDEIAELNL